MYAVAHDNDHRCTRTAGQKAVIFAQIQMVAIEKQRRLLYTVGKELSADLENNG